MWNLARGCSVCGKVVAADDNFCPRCGARLATAGTTATIQMVPPMPSPYGHWPEPSGPAASAPASYVPAPYPHPYPFPPVRWPYRPITLWRGVGIAGGIMLLIGGGMSLFVGIIMLLWWWAGALLGMLDVAAFALAVAGAVAAFKRRYRPLALFAPGFLVFAAFMTWGIENEPGLIILPFGCISLALMLMGFQEMRADAPWPGAPATTAPGPPGVAGPGMTGVGAVPTPSPYGQWPYPMTAHPQAPAPYPGPAQGHSSARRMIAVTGVVLLLVAGAFVMFIGFMNLFWFWDLATMMMLAVLYFSAVTAAIVSAVAVLVRTHRGLSLMGPALVVGASVVSILEFDIFMIFVLPIAVLSLGFIAMGMPAMRPDRPFGWTVAEPSAPEPLSGGPRVDVTAPTSDATSMDWTSR